MSVPISASQGNTQVKQPAGNPAQTGLPFHRAIFKEAFEYDGLNVLAKGIGLEFVVMKLLRVYSGGALPVLVLGMNDSAAEVRQALRSDGLPAAALPRVASNETPAAERVKMYGRGGCILVTSRIAVVDLLMRRILPHRIAGFIVMDAHRVHASSLDAFALHIYRRNYTRSGFVKAFTDDAESVVAGYGRLEQTMRALQVRRLRLWPRFHALVRRDFDACSPEVVELLQPLGPYVSTVQSSALAAMGACLEELRRDARVEVDDATLERGILESFDRQLRRQLDPVWNRVRDTTKQVLEDIRQLRKLLFFALRYDPATLLTYLDSMRAASATTQKAQSLWLHTDAADSMYKAAKERLYTVERVQGGERGARRAREQGAVVVTSGGPSAGQIGHPPLQHWALRVRLEGPPKWVLLLEVLQEAVQDHAQAFGGGGVEAGSSEGSPSRTARYAPSAPALPAGWGIPGIWREPLSGSAIVVFVRDEQTAAQVEEVLVRGPRAVLEDQLLAFLLRNAEATRDLRARFKQSQERRHAVDKAGGTAGGQPQGSGTAAAGPKQSSASSSSAGASSAGLSSASIQPPSSTGGAAAAAASAKAGAGAAPSAAPDLDDSSVFVPAEQRLLWKLTARMLRDRRAAFAREQEGSREQAGGAGGSRARARGLEGGANRSSRQVSRASGGRASEAASGASSLAGSPSRLEAAGEAQLGQRLHRAVEGLVQDSLGEEAARRRVARRRARRRGAGGGATRQRARKGATMAGSSDSEDDEDEDEDGGELGSSTATSDQPPEMPQEATGKEKQEGAKMDRNEAGSRTPSAKRRRVQQQPEEEEAGTGQEARAKAATPATDSRPMGPSSQGQSQSHVSLSSGGSLSSSSSSSSSSSFDSEVELETGASASGAGDEAAGQAADDSIRGRAQALWRAMKRTCLPRMHVVVYPLSSCQDRHQLLQDLRPVFIVAYDPEPRLTREIEVYKAQHAREQPVRAYFLQYDRSAEQQRYLAQLKAEREAFERLIQSKATLSLPQSVSALDEATVAGRAVFRRGVDGWGISVEDDSRRSGGGGMAGALASLTRGGLSDAGGAMSGVKDRGRRHIVVDMREFRSRLPSLLYQSGCEVVPVTLEVGDYVLSPDLVVERKSLSDLFGSMRSGRLYQQAQAMTRHYARAALLIEFDEKRAFSLRATNEVSREIQQHSILSRLVLLTLHFPTLSILWARSPHASVDLFLALKQSAEEPSAAHAAGVGIEEGQAARQAQARGRRAGAIAAERLADSVGGDDEGGGGRNGAGAEYGAASSGAGDGASSGAAAPGSGVDVAVEGRAPDQGDVEVEVEPNTAGVEILRQLPGVTPTNLPMLLDAVSSLRELADMSLDQLQGVIAKANAKQLFHFLHHTGMRKAVASQGKRGAGGGRAAGGR